jgi:hypothetical protein
MESKGSAEYMAECLWPGVTTADLEALEARATASAAATADESDEVRYLGSMLVPQDEVVFCFFAGPSSDAVAAVARRADIPFERVLRSVRVSERITNSEA